MMSGASPILKQFQDFYRCFPFMQMEQAIAYFALYGGIHRQIDLDLFEEITLSAEIHFVQHFSETASLISPGYLLRTPYREMLMAIARGDGRLSNIFRRARIGEEAGRKIIEELITLDIVLLEDSRQAPLRVHPKHLLKKHLRAYRIEPKVRFVKPFYRFWFGFVAPYREALLNKQGYAFTENFAQHRESAYSLLFEQLSNLLLADCFRTKDPIVSQGSFWDHHSEFDLLSVTQKGKILLGECKYTSRSVTKKELTKLKDKAMKSGIKADSYALFSKNGFSNELLGLESETLLLFDLDAYARLLR